METGNMGNGVRDIQDGIMGQGRRDKGTGDGIRRWVPYGNVAKPWDHGNVAKPWEGSRRELGDEMGLYVQVALCGVNSACRGGWHARAGV